MQFVGVLQCVARITAVKSADPPTRVRRVEYRIDGVGAEMWRREHEGLASATQWSAAPNLRVRDGRMNRGKSKGVE